MPDGSGLFFLSTKQRSRTLIEMIGKAPAARRRSRLPRRRSPSRASGRPSRPTGRLSRCRSRTPASSTPTGARPATMSRRSGSPTSAAAAGSRFRVKGRSQRGVPMARRLAFVRSSGGHGHVFVANADGSRLSRSRRVRATMSSRRGRRMACNRLLLDERHRRHAPGRPLHGAPGRIGARSAHRGRPLRLPPDLGPRRIRLLPRQCPRALPHLASPPWLRRPSGPGRVTVNSDQAEIIPTEGERIREVKWTFYPSS